jgi:hypothetical protein
MANPAMPFEPQPPVPSAAPPLSDDRPPFEPVETGSRTPSDPVPLIDRPPYDDGNDQ